MKPTREEFLQLYSRVIQGIVASGVLAHETYETVARDAYDMTWAAFFIVSDEESVKHSPMFREPV